MHLRNIVSQVERPVLLVGDTGTSKTAIINNYLRGLPPEKYVSKCVILIE